MWFILLATLSLPFSLVSATVKFFDEDIHGTHLRINKSPYFIPSSPLLTVNPSRRSDGIPPALAAVTSIRAAYSPITKGYLESHITMFRDHDDVWSDHFIDSLFVSYDGQVSAFFDEAAEKWLQSIGISHLYLSKNIRIPPKVKDLPISQIETGPPPGPYLIRASPSKTALDIFSIYRLFRDDYQSFLFGVLPRPAGGWFQTNFTLDDTGLQFIPVPSQIALMSKALPLSGTRFALKDIYDAQALPTGAGSLAYASLHPFAAATAPSIQRLLDLGATMVGKTRTSQFALGASPWEYQDIPYSWNPRADGYLTASASSSGSACAIAGYEWLEFTIGSDTRGSVRKPATFVGAYGIRPSHGSLDLKGVLPVSEEMDTAGFFTRDPRLLADIGRLWYEESPVSIKRQAIRFPKKLLYPIEHFPVHNPDAQALYDDFTYQLEKHLKVSKKPINFTQALLPYLPNGNFSLFHETSNILAEYRTWESVGKPLSEKYQKLFGSPPTLDPRPRWMFTRGAELTEDDFSDAVVLRRSFQESISTELLKPDTKSCSESLFIYDAAGTGGRPSYRFEDFNSLDGATQALLSGPLGDSLPSDYFTYVASMAGLPEVSIPLGQVEYFSQVSREWEVLPVGVQLVAHRGCDEMLLELVKKLHAEGVLKPTKVGKRAF